MADSSFSGSTKLWCNEPLKFLPVAFIWLLISVLYGIYMFWHIPLLTADSKTRWTGVWESVLFNLLVLLQVTCYLMCCMIHPGTIPEKEEDPAWESIPRDTQAAEPFAGVSLQESKRTGERRHCKWCNKYKPDRCHHCRVCKTCILKMDHHCPWIYNCVGFRNHKYFFLLLFYSVAVIHFLFWTMMPSVMNSVDSSVPFARMFSLLFGETLAAFLMVLLTGFFIFHIWLMLRATTTIEFCEKSYRRTGHDPSAYDRGIIGNTKAVLGENVYTWLLPWDPPAGKGLSFLTEDTKLTSADAEAGRGVRRRVPPISQLGDSGAPSTLRRDKGSGGTGSAPSDHSAPEDEEGSGMSGDDAGGWKAQNVSPSRLGPSPRRDQ